MSIENGFKKIARSIGIKKCVIIEGNVGDVFLSESGRIVTLRDYLTEVARTMNYRQCVYWDRIDGAVDAIDGSVSSLNTGTDVTVEGENYELDLDDDPALDSSTQGNQPRFQKISEFFPVVYATMTDLSKKALFILNYSDFLFTTASIPDEERDAVTLLAKAIRERKIQPYELDCNESCVVIISSKSSLLPLNLYQANPEVEIISLSRPDRDERKLLLEKISDGFDLRMKPGETLQSDANFANYIDLLDDVTNREIVQLARLSRKNPKLSFEKLFYLFRYGEKDNPWEKLDSQKLKNIRRILSESVIGQDEAIKKIELTVIKAFMGLTGLHKSSSRAMPKGVFFFVGPTGVGKTELSKALAKFLFGDEQACIRFDMSEYGQENSDQKLIGAPPGYVGYEEGGQLTNAIKEKPFSVILFDEIEKAAKPNPRILDIFLQILEDGRLTDSRGETVYFSDSIIIFTSNLGASEISYTGSNEQTARMFIDKVKNYFDREIGRPELLGRIGYNNIVPFNFIQSDDFIYRIAKSKLNPVIRGVYEKYLLNLVLTSESEVIGYILNGLDRSKGGRQVLNAINDKLLDPLARFLFNNRDDLREFRNGDLEVSLNAERTGLDFRFN